MCGEWDCGGRWSEYRFGLRRIVLAARSASFIQAFCKIGLVPDSGGTWTLPRVVGHARAMALTLLGDKISAEKAENWGMIWKCVDDADLMPEALKLAKHLATQPTQGLKQLKQAIHAAATNTLDQQLDLERDPGSGCRELRLQRRCECFLRKTSASL